MKGKNRLTPRLLGVSRENVMRLDEKTKEVSVGACAHVCVCMCVCVCVCVRARVRARVYMCVRAWGRNVRGECNSVRFGQYSKFPFILANHLPFDRSRHLWIILVTRWTARSWTTLFSD